MAVLLYILISFLIVKFSLKYMSRIKSRPRRITAKSLVISLFYAPCIVAIYIIALPAPFIIAVPYYVNQAIQNKSINSLILIFPYCILPLLVFWLFVFLFGYSNSIRKQMKESKKQIAPNGV